jgi:UDP-N-acetylglucosamine 2-epimerase (non-hydrolysing)
MRELCLEWRDHAVSAQLASTIPSVGPEFAVLTVHRPANADSAEAVREILSGCCDAPVPIVFPAHPRIYSLAAEVACDLNIGTQLTIIPPLSYVDMLSLVARSQCVITDSGGLQKEAFFLGTPCVTLRNETEWSETLSDGRNVLIGECPSRHSLAAAVAEACTGHNTAKANPADKNLDTLFGPPDPGRRIAEALRVYVSR